jgi:hypothetical protein
MSIVIDSFTNTSVDIFPAGFDPEGKLYAGTSFSAIDTRITSCKFYLNGNVQNGSLYAQLYAHTGTYGESTGKPTGSPLATSDAVQFVDGTRDWREFTFSSSYRLEDDYYCIIVHFDGMTVTESLSMAGVLSEDHDGMYAESEDGSTWTVNTFISLPFYVYGDPLPRIGDEYPLPPYARN